MSLSVFCGLVLSPRPQSTPASVISSQEIHITHYPKSKGSSTALTAAGGLSRLGLASLYLSALITHKALQRGLTQLNALW